MASAHREIIARCAAEHGVTVDDILGRSTHPRILAARYAALAACHEAFPGESAHRLSEWFRKDRTWAWQGLRRLAGTYRLSRKARAA